MGKLEVYTVKSPFCIKRCILIQRITIFIWKFSLSPLFTHVIWMEPCLQGLGMDAWNRSKPIRVLCLHWFAQEWAGDLSQAHWSKSFYRMSRKEVLYEDYFFLVGFHWVYSASYFTAPRKEPFGINEIICGWSFFSSRAWCHTYPQTIQLLEPMYPIFFAWGYFELGVLCNWKNFYWHSKHYLRHKISKMYHCKNT